MANTLNLKRGDTFFFYMDMKLADGVTPLILPVENFKCQIRRVNDELVDTLLVETTDTDGRYLFTALAEDTLNYPLQDLQMDVKIDDGGIVTSTQTITVAVDKDVTKWV